MLFIGYCLEALEALLELHTATVYIVILKFFMDFVIKDVVTVFLMWEIPQNQNCLILNSDIVWMDTLIGIKILKWFDTDWDLVH